MTQPKLKLMFIEVKENKKKIRTIRSMYKSALENDKDYPQALEDYKKFKAKKDLIESRIKKEMERDFEKIEKIQKEIKETEMKIANTVITSVKNDLDPNFRVDDEEYEPIIKVKYTRVK